MEGIANLLAEANVAVGKGLIEFWPDPVCGTRYYESLWLATTACARHNLAYSDGVLYPSALRGRFRL